jgi:hypothetical protein
MSEKLTTVLLTCGSLLGVYILKELNFFEKLRVALLDNATYMIELAHITIDCDQNPR